MSLPLPAFQPDPSWSGIFPDLSAEAYHRRQLGIASAGALKLVRRSPAHYAHWARTSFERRSKQMDFGSAYHSYVLTPDLFMLDYVTLPANAPRRPTEKQRMARSPKFATIEAMEWWDDFLERHAGKNIISADDRLKMDDMRAALDDEDVVGELPKIMLADGLREVSFRWIEPETGLPCRARYDYWLDDLCYGMDLKTCFDASAEGFAAAIVRNEYHVSQAHYLNGAATLGKPLKDYFFLAQETEPPYVAALWPIDMVGSDLGFELWRKAINRLGACMKTGKFYGYMNAEKKPGEAPEPRPLSLPAYAFYRE